MSTAEIEKHWVKIYLYERANVVHASELAQLDPVLDAHTRRFCYSADSPVTSSLECKPPMVGNQKRERKKGWVGGDRKTT